MVLSRRASLVFAVGDFVTAALVLLGVFAGLPTRWAPVDVPAVLLAALHLASGAGLASRAGWGVKVARAVSILSLVLGLSVVTALAATASWLDGVYGPVGMGGAVILVLVAALLLPYLVALPVVRIVWLRARET